jgi:hypothetical protein
VNKYRDVHLGLDPTGADGVHAHATSAPLGGQGPRQPYKPVLARVVGRPVHDAEKPSDRTDIDDAPATRPQHLLAELAAHQERTGEVHLQDASPVRQRGLLCGHYGTDPGVVHQRIHPPELTQHRLEHPAHRPFVRDVAGDEERSGTCLF